MKISILQAFHGDSVHIRYVGYAGAIRNILIDGGPPAAYSAKEKKGPPKQGFLADLVSQIREANEAFDLLVLTHIDDDHIGGLIEWFRKDKEAFGLVKEIWFNSSGLISEYFGLEEKPERKIKFFVSESTRTSVAQGIFFEDQIKDSGAWRKDVVKAGDSFQLDGITLKVLSPDEAGLKAIEEKWEKEKPETATGRRKNDYQISIGEHINDDVFVEDRAVPNQSSVAFIVSYQDLNFLYLADAHPTTVVKSLRELGYSKHNRLALEFVKLAHHGSKGNTSDELLDLLDCKRFIISTNGDRHELPDKRCLARIINRVPDAEFYFNYPDRITRIFSEDDRTSYPEFKTFAVVGPFEY